MFMTEKIIEIKAFSQEMYLFVNNLTKQLTEGKKSLSEDNFRAIVESPCTRIFVIHDTDQTPVGMLSVGIYRTPSGKKAWIEDVTIDEQYRGSGYGQKIVEHAINHIRDSDVDVISLTSNASRVAANKLYQKLRFEIYPTNVYRMRLSNC